MTLEQAVERAYQTRADYLAALERVQAAEAARQAVVGEALPAVRVNADYGDIGLSPRDSHGTFSVTGAVQRPDLPGRAHAGRLLEADADLRSRRAEAEDLKAAIYYEVRTAFLDLQASNEQLQVATRGARSGGAAADAGARSVRRRRRQQHRSRAGAGGRRARQRAVHLGALRLRPREGRAGPRRRHRRRHRCDSFSEAFADGRSTAVDVVHQPAARSASPSASSLLAVVGVGVWFWITAGRESTDDAQVDAHVTPIAARVGGTVLRVPVADNQQVEAGAVLVEIDPRDYQIARRQGARRAGRRRSGGARGPEQRADHVDRRRRATSRRRGAASSRRRAASTRRRTRARSGAGAAGDGAGAAARGGSECRRRRRATSSGCAVCSPRTKSRSSSSTPRWRRPTRRGPRPTRRGRRSPRPKPASASPRASSCRRAPASSRRRRSCGPRRPARSRWRRCKRARGGGRGARRSRPRRRSRRPS